MKMQHASKKIREITAAIEAASRRLPRRLGTEVVRFAHKRFERRDWDGAKWPQRKNPNGKKNKGRALLIKSGRGRRSIRLASVTATTATITAIGYMQPHNDGFKGTVQVRGHKRETVRKKKTTHYREDTGEAETLRIKYRNEAAVKPHSRRMSIPRRRFLGDSPVLRRALMRQAQAEFNDALKPFLKP